MQVCNELFKTSTSCRLFDADTCYFLSANLILDCFSCAIHSNNMTSKKTTMANRSVILLLSIFGLIFRAAGVELTFELPDNARECFYQEIEKNVTSTLEFQVCLYNF